jgi:hypothetical protein
LLERVARLARKIRGMSRIEDVIAAGDHLDLGARDRSTEFVRTPRRDRLVFRPVENEHRNSNPLAQPDDIMRRRLGKLLLEPCRPLRELLPRPR